MRKLISALCVAFALGVVAPATWAGEGCGWGSHSKTKKNDFETPPPVSLQKGQTKS